jgi:hypothetical protein
MKTFRIKFPRRVRIHGGECGAVARALHHKAQKVALTQNEQSLISDECSLLRQADLEKSSISTFIERKQMSTKTSIKRVALVAVSALGFGLLSVVPSTAAVGPSTKVQSSVSGTIAAVANGGLATGTFSVTLNEAAATTWTDAAADQEIVFGLVTRYGAADQCWVDGNDDTTPAGTVTVTGESDTLFATAANEPSVTVDESAKTFTVTIGADTSDNSEVESITVSGLVVKCSTAAPAGKIYVVVESGAAELDPAYVNATYTTAEAVGNFVVNNERINISNSATTSNFPFLALTGESMVLGGKYIPVDGMASISDATFDFTGGAAEDVFAKTAHGLTTTDKVYLQSPPAGFTANTAYYVIRTDADNFQLATSVANALAGTQVEGTADDTAVTIDMAWVDVNTGALANLSCTAAAPAVCTSAAHGLSTGDALVFTAMDSFAATGAALNVRVGGTVYIGRLTANTFSLAVTYDDALRGNYITGTTASAGAVTAVNKTATFAAGSIASGATITLYGPDSLLGSADSNTYLGQIGSVSTSFNSFVDTTKIVTTVADAITTANNDGEINVVTNTSGAIADSTATTITITLTGGSFASAPTVTAAAGTCTLDATHTYPRSSITITSSAGSCTGVTVVGAIDASGLAVGSSVSFTATVANGTNPTSYTTVLQNRNLITYGAATAVAATQASVASSSEDSVATTAAVTESAAGVFKAGYYLSICFADATGNDLFSTDVKNVWATVTSGDLKLEGNATSALATMDNDSSGNTTYAGTAKQCAQVRIYSASTAASTITWSAGTATAAESTTGFRMDSGSAAGAITMGVFLGSTVNLADLYTTFVLGSRTAAANYTIAAASTPDVTAGGAAQAYGDITISEAKYGKFAAGAITVDLTDSAGNASAVATFAATAGANAPVVTQTNANSEIRWSYVVTDFNTITITVAGASTANAATFKVSNIKVNLSDVKSSGVAVNSADVYVTVGGAGIGSASYPVQAAKVKAVATTTTADALLELAKAIGTGKEVEAATDAAAEAIDAANAATDAANLAAEAADAATVAAEEARDAADAATAAVEELATQVASLMSALKAQLTTLANTVAKIAKKVKA